MRKIYLGLIGLVIAVGIVDCKRDSTLMSEPESEPKNVDGTATVGTLMYSELFRDDQLIEQSVDSLINMGSEETPAYFYVNVSHTVDNIPVQDMRTTNCAFRSFTLDDLEEFIKHYAKIQFISASENLTNEEETTAYQDLYSFTQENNIDVAELINLTKDNEDLLASTLTCGKIVPAKGPEDIHFTIPDSLLPYFIHSELTMSEKADSIKQHIACFRDALKMPYGMKFEDETSAPDAYNTNTFVSIINKDDFNYVNYYGTEKFDSPKYTFKYGTEGHPMVQGEFYVHGWYKSKRKGDTEPIIYIPYLKTIITKAHIGVSMRMVSNVMYEYNGILIMNLRDYVAHGRGEINIEYGDSWAVKRQAQLKFRVYADKGFEEVSWTDR